MLSDSLVFGADPDYAVSVHPPTPMGRGIIGERAGWDWEAQVSERVLERTSALAVPECVGGGESWSSRGQMGTWSDNAGWRG
jgi:hypothetical protein